MEKRVVIRYFVILMIFSFLLFSLVYFRGGMTGFAVFTPGPGEGQTTLTLQEADVDNLGDSYVSGSFPNTNYGSSDELWVKWGNPNRNSYMSFNISYIPKNQIIDNALLCLYLFSDYGSQTISAHQVYSEFSESEITWNNQPCGVNFDDSVNCNLTGDSSLSNDGSQDNTWQCLNITNAVRRQYDNSDNNLSIVLHTEDAIDFNDKFYSKEYSDNSLIPHLNVTYHTANTAPSLTLVSPQEDVSYGYNESLALNFSASDIDENIDSCWYNLNSGVNISLAGCANTTFDVSEGSHTLTIYVNDTHGEETSDSTAFSTDVTGISLSISDPEGTKSSRTEIPIIYTVTGDNLTCWYNIKTSVEGDVIGNTTLENCSSSNFNVSSDGDYVFNLYANNSLGTFKSISSEFSVDTSSSPIPPPSNGGGGGGGGGSAPAEEQESEFPVSLSGLEEVVIRPGESKTLSLEARNTGGLMQNNCKIISSGWISGSDEKDLNANEKADFVFMVGVPKDTEIRDYDVPVSLKCQDGEENVNLKVSVIGADFDVSIKDIAEIKGNKITFIYVLRELSGNAVSLGLDFAIIDVDGKKIAEASDFVSLGAGEEKETSREIEVPAGTFGEYMLIVGAESQGVSVRDERTVLIAGKGATGFAGFFTSGSARRYVSIGILILISAVLGFFIVRKIIKTRKHESARKGVVKLGKKTQ